MPLILEDENKRFGGRQIALPKDLTDLLKQKQVQYSDKSYRTSKGYKRLQALLSKDYNAQSDRKDRQETDKPTISFSDAKRILHDIKAGMSKDEFDMIGGQKMQDFVSNSLRSMRNSVQKVKPVPEVPKLSPQDVKPEEPKNVIKAGKVEVTVEDKEFSENITKIF
jgi:hypothetical protein